MFISKINFNQYQTKNTNYQQNKFVTFKGLNSNIIKNAVTAEPVIKATANAVKKTLLAITAFAAAQGITLYKVKEAAQNGELDMQGKKVDIEGEKTKDYLRRVEMYKQLLVTKTDFASENGISLEKIKEAIANNELDMVGSKINPEGEKTKDYVQRMQMYKQTHMPRKTFGELVGITGKSVEWHIAKGNLVANEDGTVDPTNEKNRYFLENFKKGATKQAHKYTTENYDVLQRKLGPIKIDFCLERGYLVADEDGSINMENPINKEFLEKVAKKEIQIFDFYMSKKDFARYVHQHDMTIKKAIESGELIEEFHKGIDINHPQNKAYIEKALANQKGPGGKLKKLPEGYISRQDLADKLGFKLANLQYHVSVGHLIADEYGIDLNNPINKHFIDNYKKGVLKTMPEGFEAVARKGQPRAEKPNHVSINKLAKRLGMSTATLQYHIFEGHVIRTEDGIDLTHPQNVHFLNNYKRGEEYIMPNEVKKVKPIQKEETPKNYKVKTNFNHLFMHELSKMVKICVSALGFHFDRGRLEKTEDKKIDLSSPLNREFIAKYDNSIKEAYANMSDEELEESVMGLKELLKKRIGENVYVVSAGSLDDSEFLNGYLKYSLDNIVDTSDLTEEQIKLLVSMMEDIVLDELSNDEPSKTNFFESEGKLDILAYKHLLNEIIKRENSNVVSEETEATVEEVGASPEMVQEELSALFENLKNEYVYEIDAYKKVSEKSMDQLAESYLRSRFNVEGLNYTTLKNFTKEVKNGEIVEDLDDKNVEKIVQEDFVRQNAQKNADHPLYSSWRKGVNPNNLRSFVATVIEKYRQNLLNKICTEELLVKMQQANPYKEITMQDLEEFVNEKLDLE